MNQNLQQDLLKQECEMVQRDFRQKELISEVLQAFGSCYLSKYCKLQGKANMQTSKSDIER